MNFATKIEQLQKLLAEILLPLIDCNYVLLDVPYYNNIGDVLIWQGTHDLLKLSKHKCLMSASKETWDYRPLKPDVIILLQGGGNFGDLWIQHQEFRNNVIRKYPNNKIIILPQTIFYNDKNRMLEDAHLMACHKNLYICARDERSYELLKLYFAANPSFLLPDMAFCVSANLLEKWRVTPQNKTLLLMRADKELADREYARYIQEQAEVEQHDWPSYEYIPPCMLNFYRLMRRRKYLGRLVDIYADRILRPDMVRLGIRFVSSYQHVYTTRLHVAILSTILHKPYSFFDNSYGKNSQFYITWLKDVEGIRFVEWRAENALTPITPISNEDFYHNSCI